MCSDVEPGHAAKKERSEADGAEGDSHDPDERGPVFARDAAIMGRKPLCDWNIDQFRSSKALRHLHSCSRNASLIEQCVVTHSSIAWFNGALVHIQVWLSAAHSFVSTNVDLIHASYAHAIRSVETPVDKWKNPVK